MTTTTFERIEELSLSVAAYNKLRRAGVETIAELLALADAGGPLWEPEMDAEIERALLPVRRLLPATEAVEQSGDWGPWRLNADVLVLTCRVRDRYDYEVDLERCLTPDQALDWIVHVAGKRWAKPVFVSGLVQALDDILALQGCQGGKHLAPTTDKLKQRVARFS